MTTADEHAQIVLSAIIPSRSDLLDKAFGRLAPDHFVDSTTRKLWELVIRYYETVAKVMPRDALSDLLRNRTDPAKAILFEELYDSLADRVVDDADFTWSVEQLRELAAERATQETLTRAMEILRTGVQEPGKDRKQGQADAWDFVIESRADIERSLTMQSSPEGDVRQEHIEMLNDYAERKRLRESGLTRGIRFGIPALDGVISGGVQPGELVMVAGGSSSGKTGMCVGWSWSAAIEQGKNVVFFTTETLRDQVRRRLVSRHSKHPMFDMPDGLNSKDLREGTLTPGLEAKLEDVLDDFTSNPAYGRLYVAQIPRGAGVNIIESNMYRLQRQFHIDFVVMDYVALLSASVRRGQSREEQAEKIKETAQLCKTFDDGRGVPFVTPWQMTRTDQDEAERTGYYNLNSLAETAEATNSADIAISLLGMGEPDTRYRELKAQVLKNRDGMRANSLSLRIDYATSTITDFAAQGGGRSLMDDEGPDDLYGGLLGN